MPSDEESNSLNDILAQALGVLARRWWWILLPFCGVTLLGIAVILKLPNHYTSEATLVVVRQQVPERYVVPNSTTDVNAVLQALKQEALSRTRLTKIIEEFGLYQTPNKRQSPEALVDLMLQNTNIEPIIDDPARKDFDAFKITFVAGDPLLAQAVASNLTSIFISENLRTRNEQATNTTNFLHDEVEAKRKLLERQEERLRDFKLRNVGELPEQQAGNLGILNGLQGQLSNTMASLNRAQQQRVYIQSLINASRRQATPAGVVAVSPGSPPASRVLTPVDSALADLARLEADRASMVSRGYTAQHPDRVKLQREIAKAQETLARLRASAPRPAGPTPFTTDTPPTPTAPIAEGGDQTVIAQLQSQLESNRLEIENLANDERRFKSQVTGYENRLNQTPVREQEQAAILRDTEALRLEYQDLQKKEQESQLATNLEKQQGGQQFKLIDPPSLPSIPSSPRRVKLSAAAAAGGLFLGVALAFLMEMRDSSFHTEKDLTKHLSPPFVLGIPLLPTLVETRQRRWKSLFQWVAAATMVTVLLAAEVYVYRRG